MHTLKRVWHLRIFVPSFSHPWNEYIGLNHMPQIAFSLSFQVQSNTHQAFFCEGLAVGEKRGKEDGEQYVGFTSGLPNIYRIFSVIL